MKQSEHAGFGVLRGHGRLPAQHSRGHDSEAALETTGYRFGSNPVDTSSSTQLQWR